MLTEENAPFNFTEDGALKGIAVDLIVAAMKDASSEVSPAEIQVVPWARGYDAARNQPGTMLFSMARTQERESLFSWVGPIYKAQIGLVAPKSRNIRINSPAELSAYAVATVRDGAPEQLLVKAGVPEKALDRGNGIEANLRKLLDARVDMVAFNIPAVMYNLARMGEDPSNYSVVYVLKELDLHYAFHRTTDPALLKAVQDALDRVRSSGGYDAIVRRYLK
jgi:polar amino acid transport system substrate-binding protein